MCSRIQRILQCANLCLEGQSYKCINVAGDALRFPDALSNLPIGLNTLEQSIIVRILHLEILMNKLPDDSNKRKIDERNQRYLEGLQRSGDVGVRVLATILNTIADGVIVLDEDLTIVLSNYAAGKLASSELDNLARPELRNNFKFFKNDGTKALPPEEEPIVVALRTGKPYEMEGYVTGASLPPEGVWIRAHAAPLLGEEDIAIGGVTVFHNITQRVRLQKQRDYLAALIAHDIKNHLAAETSFLDLLVGLFPDNFDERMVSFISELKQSSKHFVGIANSLLELSRCQFFDTDAYGQSIDLKVVLESIVDMNRLIATDRNVALAVSVCGSVPDVCGIPAVLQQAFHNIVLNAVEVSDSGTSVNIVISCHEDLPFASVTICDQGPGMTPDEVAILFDPARVASHRRSRTDSTGFGLYLSAMLIEGQGGRIFCSSEVGKGTSVRIDVPLMREDHPGHKS